MGNSIARSSWSARREEAPFSPFSSGRSARLRRPPAWPPHGGRPPGRRSEHGAAFEQQELKEEVVNRDELAMRVNGILTEICGEQFGSWTDEDGDVCFGVCLMGVPVGLIVEQ